MHDSTVDGLILLQFPDLPFLPLVKYPQIAILTARIDNLVMFTEPNCSDIALKLPIERSLHCIRTIEVIDFACIRHAGNQPLFIIRHFYPVRDQVEFSKLDLFVRVVSSCAGIPEFDGTIIGPACQFQCHDIISVN